MGKMMNSQSAWSMRMALVALLATASVPSIAAAEQNGDRVMKTWMAASNTAPSFALGAWGRLSLMEGDLRFESADYEWSLSLSDIKRLDVSRIADGAFEVETYTGGVFFVSVLNAQMQTDSPGKAVGMLQRAVREAPATSRQTLVAGGPK